MDELEKLKINPRDVHILLITHKHPDHIENNYLFPNATIYSEENINQLVLLNTKDFVQSGIIMLENGPEKIIAYETDNTFFISSRNGTIVYEIDPVNKMIKKSIELFEMPTSLALHPKKKLLYVGSSKSDIITIVDTESGSIIRTIKLPIETQFPSDLEITKDGKWLIVTSESTNTISIIDLVKENVAVKLNVKATTHAAVIVEE